MNIVHAYNENGIYFLFRHILWWFNGKRFEKWLYCPNIRYIFVYNKHIYAGTTNYTMCILENQKFKSLKDLFRSTAYINHWCICLDDDGNRYDYSRITGPFTKNGYFLSEKSYPYQGTKLLYNDGFLYHFSFLKNGINEKFDIQNNQWSLFDNQRFYQIDDVHLLNKLFYILFTNGKIGIYNSKSDSWQLLDISLHSHS